MGRYGWPRLSPGRLNRAETVGRSQLKTRQKSHGLNACQAAPRGIRILADYLTILGFADHYRQAHVTALDWPDVLAVAAENARRAGVAERYALRPGSAFDVAWGGPYDIVLLTNFLHHFDVPTCEQLAAKAYAALAPGGRALTLDFIPEPDRITPPSTATFALVMLATTAHGDAYTFAEFQAMFARAGFLRSEFHALPPTTQQAVVSYTGCSKSNPTAPATTIARRSRFAVS